MLTIPLRRGSHHHQKQKMKSFCGHEEFLARIAKSLYYVELPLVNCTSLPVTGEVLSVTKTEVENKLRTVWSLDTIILFKNNNNQNLPSSFLTKFCISVIMKHQVPYRLSIRVQITARNTELASEIFSEVNKFSLNRLDIEKAAHLSRSASVSPCLLVLALLYLERLKAFNPKYLAKVSPTELFLISLVVGSKFLQDEGEGDELSNTEWADLIGVSVQEINKAEKQFLDAINWEVFVSKEEFWSRFKSLETNVGLRQGCKRGWFTYTELNLLLQLIDLTSLAHCVWNVTAACLVSYTASVLALVGSALLVGQIPGLGLRPKVAAEVAPCTTHWSPTETATLLPAPHSHGNVSPPVEFPSRPNASEPEPVNVCGVSRWSETPETNVRKGVSWGLLSGLYRGVSSASGVDGGEYLMVESSKEANPFFLLKSLNPWTWSDYIGNYLMKNSVPGSFTRWRASKRWGSEKHSFEQIENKYLFLILFL